MVGGSVQAVGGPARASRSSRPSRTRSSPNHGDDGHLTPGGVWLARRLLRDASPLASGPRSPAPTFRNGSESWSERSATLRPSLRTLDDLTTDGSRRGDRGGMGTGKERERIGNGLGGEGWDRLSPHGTDRMRSGTEMALTPNERTLRARLAAHALHASVDSNSTPSRPDEPSWPASRTRSIPTGSWLRPNGSEERNMPRRHTSPASPSSRP